MKGPIKSVLAEELQNSLRMKKGYEKALRSLPSGCLARRVIRGNEYYYLARKKRGKVHFEYRGKISKDDIKRYAQAKQDRARYRHLLSRVKKQIKFLKGALRGKEAI